ncbi:MAG: hypothetical protein ABIP38_07415 [Steroidobacteraceae bacterium]
MSAIASDLPSNFAPRLTAFEAEFVRTVLEHRGLFREPSQDEFAAALQVLHRFDEQMLANPGHEDRFAPRLDGDDMAALRAKAYMMFGTIRPSPAQWHKAHTALFGPLLCETCG